MQLRSEAEVHAQRAIDHAADDADAVFNVSLHYWHVGELDRSVELLERTLELDPNHVLAEFLVKGVLFTCRTAPEEILEAARSFDTALLPENPIRWVTLTWISLLEMNNGNWEAAEDASRRAWLIFRTPDTVMRYAAILVHLQKVEVAKKILEQLHSNWPTLNPRHYARVTMFRRCAQTEQLGHVTAAYGSLEQPTE